MELEILKKKFDEVYELQNQLLDELRKKNNSQSVNLNTQEIAVQIEKYYDELKTELLGNYRSQLVKFEFGIILPRNTYSLNEINESIVCLETWRWIHRKLFHI